MNKNIHMQNHVEKVMSSIDNIQRAEPKPFFFTRLQARIDRREAGSWELIIRTLARPVIATAGILGIILINTLAIVNKTTTVSHEIPEHAEMAIADEYNSTIAYYAIENAQP